MRARQPLSQCLQKLNYFTNALQWYMVHATTNIFDRKNFLSYGI